MKTQTKIIGTIDILLGLHLIWTLVPLFESVSDFIENEITMTVLIVGLILGGFGLWTNIKIGWIANQLTGIHILLSTLAGIVISFRSDKLTNDSGYYFILFTIIVLMGGRLLWTNKQQLLDEFKISSKLQLITILIGTLPSLVFMTRGYA